MTEGYGWAQREGGPIEEIRPGDVVWFPPGEKHWHGASPTTAMTHIAMQEPLDGKTVEWMENVADEQYEGERAARRGWLGQSPVSPDTTTAVPSCRCRHSCPTDYRRASEV